MTLFPNQIDTDVELPRVSDDLTDLSSDHINSLRDAIFAIEKNLGRNVQGTLDSLVDFLSISLNTNGTIKNSALEAAGLVSLPIVNKHIAANAGILESKLQLLHSTADLYSAISSNSTTLNSLISTINLILADINFHVFGTSYLSNKEKARHVASHIDLNQIPSDERDVSYIYSGLKDRNNALRSATHVMEALLQINNDLIAHQNAVNSDEHNASAISVNVENFNEIPKEAKNLQKVIDYLDDNEKLNIGQHRATQHANAIPKNARTNSFLSAKENIIPNTTAITYLVVSPNNSPVDNLSNGDDIIKFVSNNTNFNFDAKFSQVKPGDIITVNYQNGIESEFIIDSIRYIPNVEYIVRINGVNKLNTTNAIAKIDKPLYSENTYNIFATASTNIRNSIEPIYTELIPSLIVSDPKAACVLGLGFDAGQINSEHYKLYLEFYPTGNPLDKIVKLPAIDISGNSGSSPGKYTLESIVQSTNDKFREIGYNYRFIAFSYNGEFGISLSDSINGASFAVISGINSSGTLSTGSYTENVIGGSSLDNFDCFGFGSTGINIASPSFQSTWIDSTAAQNPTKIISPLKHKFAYVNGQKLDSFAKTYLSSDDGYWDGYISAVNPVGNSNVEVTYTIPLDLRPSGLKSGKTITIQPAIAYTDSLFNDIDYGRFFIKNIVFSQDCDGILGKTDITVVNGIHALGNGFSLNSGQPPLPVKIYFSYDSVSFDNQNVIDLSTTSTDYSRFYEIYLDETGKTFSHERARLPRQTETSKLLATTNFHIYNVSPKLRGYSESNPLLFNKYIRFFVKNYNSITGEYDGYLGQISGDSVLKVGPTTTGRKNVISRFYDETYVDYIDLIFVDNSIYPGLSVLSSSIGRYVDIELFPSLQQDDELFLLSTCELNWSPNSGENIIQYCSDKRQFGSVDETDFTNSAKDYISIVDKHIHLNGVFNGFDLDFISSVPDSGEIFFKGGNAIVNGKFILSNNNSVTIPRIYQHGTSLPQNVTWVVCLNEFGNLKPLVLTTEKQQFFATPGSSNYYVESVSFSELIISRTDLLPLRIITSTVGSLNITDHADIRKFVYKQDSLAPLTLVSSDKIIGNFTTFSALKEWVNRSDGYEQFVKVKGNFVQKSTDSYFDLSGFTKKIIFEGEGSKFYLNASKGIKIGSNVVLRNFSFNYIGTESFSSGNLLNVTNGSGCIFNEINSSIENVVIENCEFYHENNTQRPPFILFQFNKGNEAKNILIKNNKFYDGGSGYVNSSQCAVAFYTFNSGGSTDPALLYNCQICNNYCNLNQGIFITTVYGVFGTEFQSPGISCINCKIANNICGIIGFATSGSETSSETLTNLGKNYSLSICENNCNVIANLCGDGTSPISSFPYGTGNICVKNNNVHWIYIHTFDSSSSQEYSSLLISENILTAFDIDYLNIFNLPLPNYAIYVPMFSSSDISNVIISNNQILTGVFGSNTYNYSRGINCHAGMTVTGNVIKGLAESAIGIDVLSTGTSNKRAIITGNQIYRNSENIAAYIALPGSGTKVSGIIKDNFFDSPTVDGSSEETITGSFNQFIVESNINQTVSCRASLYSGKFGTGSTTPLMFGDSTISATYDQTGIGVYDGNSDHNCQIVYDSSISADRFIYWAIQLDEILPKGVYVTEVSSTMNATLPFTTSSITISLMGTGLSTLSQSGAPTTITTGAGQTLTVTVPNRNYIVNNSIRPIAKLYGTLKVNSGGSILNITDFTIKYRW